jgi:hypothetical protein
MADDTKLPIVTYWVHQGFQREERFGYLVYRDEAYWCVPTEESAKIQPYQSCGFQLDQRHLREQPDTGADRNPRIGAFKRK